jgi:hypothetical protein
MRNDRNGHGKLCDTRDSWVAKRAERIQQAIINILEDDGQIDEYDNTIDPDASEDLPAFYVFMQARTGKHTTKGWGEAFAAYIRKQKLGEVTASKRRKNPGHATTVTVFTWALNRTALVRWAKAYLKAPSTKSKLRRFR